MQDILTKLEKECINRTIPLEKENSMLNSLLNLYNNNHKLEIVQTQINFNRMYLESKLIQVYKLCNKIVTLEKNQEYKILNDACMEKIKATLDTILESDIKVGLIDSNIIRLTNANSIQYNVADNLLAIRQYRDSKWLYDYFTKSIPLYLKNDENLFVKFIENKDNALFLNSIIYIEDIYNMLSKHMDTINKFDANNNLREVEFNKITESLLSNVNSTINNIEPQQLAKPIENSINTLPPLPQELPITRSTLVPQVKRSHSILPKPRPSSRLTLNARLPRQKSMIPSKSKRLKLSPEIAPITAKELATVPTYMRGRTKLEDLNVFVMALGTAFRGKYQLIEKGLKPGGTSSMNKEMLDLFYAYKEEMDALGDAFYVREDDISHFSGSKVDKRCLNYATILRHLGKIREERMKGKKVCYVLQS